VKDILAELHGEPSGGLLDVNKTLDKVRQRYYWLHARKDVEKCDTCATGLGPLTKFGTLRISTTWVLHSKRYPSTQRDPSLRVTKGTDNW
jgi:hypothetical protein